MLAVAASANGNTAGYGQLNPALYLLAQQSPGTYLNDVTSGNTDYNATAGGQFPAMAGYDMATGLGTPVASALATGLTSVPLSVTISGSQTYGGSPTFTASANFAGTGTTPFGVTLDSSGLTCTTVGTATTIGPSLAPGSYSLLSSQCSGLFSGVPTPTTTPSSTRPRPATSPWWPSRSPVAVSGTQTYGGTATFTGTDNPPSGVTVDTSGLVCTIAGIKSIGPTTPAGSYTLAPAGCSGATLSGVNATGYSVVYTTSTGDFTVGRPR